MRCFPLIVLCLLAGSANSQFKDIKSEKDFNLAKESADAAKKSMSDVQADAVLLPFATLGYKLQVYEKVKDYQNPSEQLLKAVADGDGFKALGEYYCDIGIAIKDQGDKLYAEGVEAGSVTVKNYILACEKFEAATERYASAKITFETSKARSESSIDNYKYALYLMDE